MGWNEICSSKIGPNIGRILFAVELGQSRGKSNLSSTDNLVLDMEFLCCLSAHIVAVRSYISYVVESYIIYLIRMRSYISYVVE